MQTFITHYNPPPVPTRVEGKGMSPTVVWDYYKDYFTNFYTGLTDWTRKVTQVINTGTQGGGPDITAATTITISAYQHVVFGTAQIQFIQSVPNLPASHVTLISANGFSLITGGNIATPKVVRANEAVMLVWNPVGQLWHPIATVSDLTKVDAPAQTAAVPLTTLYAVPFDGLYRVSYAAKVTTPASVSSSLGGANGFQVTYTDADDSVVVTTDVGPVSTLNTTQAQINGAVIVNAKAGTDIQYTFDYTSVGTPMEFALHAAVEAL